MAIRDKTTYVRKRPDMPAASTRVYLDVEGIPDTGLFYLIGLLVVKDGEQVRHQFWADSELDQEAMWHNFLSVLAELDDYVVVHFGRYEKDFVREMFQRYGGYGGISEEGLLSRLFDVHAAIRTNVFFPVNSNGLKEIASFLGFQWQGQIRSGIDSIVWRCKWEEEGTRRRRRLCSNTTTKTVWGQCRYSITLFLFLTPRPGRTWGSEKRNSCPTTRRESSGQ